MRAREARLDAPHVSAQWTARLAPVSDDLEAEIEVREDQIKDVRVGLRCEIVPTADTNRTYHGRVDRIMPIADDTKNIIKVRVKVQLPENEAAGSLIKPKMSTIVRIFNVETPDFTAPKK